MKRKRAKTVLKTRSRARKLRTGTAHRAIPKASLTMAAAKECVTCKYEGKEYSEGAVICVGKKAYRCQAGEWISWGRC